MLESISDLELINILFALRLIEGIIMFWGVGKIIFDLNRKNKNIHLSNGRGYASAFVAFLWCAWTFNYAAFDYINIFLLKNYPIRLSVITQIGIELANIIATCLTAALLLGYEFKWIKDDESK